MNAMSSRMTSGIGANRWPIWTITSMGWLVLPNSAIDASPVAASWPRWKVPDSQ
jgi:hypothetical protein